MREVRFRAWDKHTKVMTYYVDVYSADENWWSADVVDPNTKDTKYCFDSNTGELMEYTGLRDKDGKKIFEGDILNAIVYPPDKKGGYDSIPIFKKDNQITIGFDKGCFVVLPEAHLWRFIANINDTSKTDYQIIGNVYENPELL
jgi:uncharacterized phage protein (TIGR01671 family)